MEISKDLKRIEKEKLLERLLSLYDNKAEECQWNPNDAFDMACWFLGEIIVTLAKQEIIPIDELHKRTKRKTAELIDDVFRQIKDRNLLT